MAGGLHLDQVALAVAGQLVDDGAGVFVVHVDDGFLNRLQALAVLLAEDDARARDRQFEPFAAHVLDQHAHLQFAPARDHEGVAAGRVLDLDGDVGFGLFHQAFANDAGLDLVAIATGQRAVVDAEGHADGRRIDGLGGQGGFDIQRAKRVGDGRLGHAGKADDIARHRLVNGRLSQAAEGENLGDAELFDPFAVARQGLDGVARLRAAGLDPTSQDAADEGVGAQGRRQHLEGLVLTRDLFRRLDVA